MNKFYYYLLPTEVRYELKGETNYVRMDTLTKVDNPFITIKDIGQAQQASQVRFFREFMDPSPDIVIKDVVVLSVSYLGHMTEEEFNVQPEPMPSDTPDEDKSVQEVVEERKPVQATEAPNPVETTPVVIPAEPSNEADKG